MEKSGRVNIFTTQVTIDKFSEIDIALRKLGQSDSSIEYAGHIRQEFENTLQCINSLKYRTGNGQLIKNSDWYFE